MSLCIVSLPDHAHTAKENDDKELEHEDLEQHSIHDFHDIAHFGWHLSLVLHDLSIVPHVNRDTIDIVCISQGSSSEKQLLNAQNDGIRELRGCNVPFPFLEILIRFITCQLSVKVPRILITQRLNLWHRLLLLESRFSIKIQSVDIRDSIFS